MRSAWLHVGSDVSMRAMEIRWHDRRGQHGCILDRMCLYAPIQNMNLSKRKIVWHDRRGQHGGVLDRMCQYARIRKYKLLKYRLAMCELLS